MKRQKRLVFDADRCMGCCACEIACKMEYRLDRGLRLIVMEQREVRKGTQGKLTFRLNMCRQCPDAPCMDVCHKKAISKRDDGIVVVDRDLCTGCRLCLAACRFHIPVFEELGDGKAVMRKCQMCHERLDAGLMPACAAACPAEAIRVTER
ncbi:MAG: ferredoxin [Eubacterium sp.]|nr:ferredoxin [Eubacterium sp.]